PDGAACGTAADASPRSRSPGAAGARTPAREPAGRAVRSAGDRSAGRGPMPDPRAPAPRAPVPRQVAKTNRRSRLHDEPWRARHVDLEAAAVVGPTYAP